LSDIYLTLSIGLVYEGRHHKLIAGILIPSNKNNHHPFEIIHQGRLQEKNVRPFTKKEISNCKKAFVVPSQEGLSLCIRNKDGGEHFILLDDGITIEPWERINLKKALIVTYIDSMGKEIKRLRTVVPTKSSIFKKILKFFTN
jgi:hypothetical protein